MKTTLLLLTIGFAMFGFLAWYALSATLRHRKTFQIQFDICSPYVNRFYRRRVLLFIIYVLLPFLAIFHWQYAGTLSSGIFMDLFNWNQQATLWTVALVPVALIYNMIYAGRDFNLTEFPEIRVTRWTPKILMLSAITKAMQVFAIEFMFRWLLLGAVIYVGFNDISAIIIAAGLFALTNYYKANRYALFSIPYGILAGYITLTTNTLLPVFIIHLAFSLFNEWFSVRKHPEMRFV